MQAYQTRHTVACTRFRASGLTPTVIAYDCRHSIAVGTSGILRGPWTGGSSRAGTVRAARDGGANDEESAQVARPRDRDGHAADRVQPGRVDVTVVGAVDRGRPVGARVGGHVR